MSRHDDKKFPYLKRDRLLNQYFFNVSKLKKKNEIAELDRQAEIENHLDPEYHAICDAFFENTLKKR